MRNWLPLLLILALTLAACGDEPAPPPRPTDTPPGIDATGEPENAFELEPLVPGLRVRNGLTVLTHSEGVREGTGYFFAEVRNDSGQLLSQVDAVIYALDEDGLKLTDRPTRCYRHSPDRSYAGQSFACPMVTPLAALAVVHPSAGLQGVFNLPASVTSQGTSESGLYTVSGTAQNTADADLYFPVIDVALIGPDDDLVGLAHAVLVTGRDDGVWPAGAEAPFEAQFSFISVGPELVSGVRISAVGYLVP